MPTRKSVKSADSKLKLIEENIGVGTWTWDLETTEISWSPGLYKLLGMDPHAIIPSIDIFQSLVHPDDQQDFDDAVGIVSEKRMESRRFRIIRPDGTLRWLHGKTQPHLDRNGKTIMLVGTMRDITEEQVVCAAFSSQRDSNKLLGRLLEGKVWRAHANGKLIETADWSRLTGQTPQQAHDWTALDAIHPEDREAFRSAWRVAIANAELYETRVRVRRIDGSYVLTHNQALPLLDANGMIEQWIGYSVHPASGEQITPAGDLVNALQIRAARALLDWSAPDLAERASVSFSTIRRMEQSTSAVRSESVNLVRRALEDAGVMFCTLPNGNASISLGISK